MKSNHEHSHSTLIQKFRKDFHFRIKAILLFTFVFNVIYSLFLFVSSWIYSSSWFLVMSVYYALLSIVRIYTYCRTSSTKREIQKVVTMRNCGYLLFLLNLVVSVMMFVLIYTTRQVKYHEIIVIALATYTFTDLTIAILSTIKYIKRKDYDYSTIKTISLISSVVSIVTLTNIMLATFGESNAQLRSIILPLLCSVVAMLILASAIIMIIKSNSKLRIIRNEK